MLQSEINFLPIVETFHSIQGEGYWSGSNAFFIRLAGCDVGCSWCDQKESWTLKHPQHNITSLVTDAIAHHPKFIVITGGKPESVDLVIKHVLMNPQWRISLQTHKFLKVR